MSSFRDTGTRFEWTEQGETCFADYRLNAPVLHVDFVFSPPALRGTGAAGRLMGEIFALAQQRGWSINPVCGYAAAWLRRNGK